MKSIVYASEYVPPEWIAAHGLRPRKIIPPSPRNQPELGMEGVCPYARAFVLAASQDAEADAVIVAATCDQMRRLAEWLGRPGDKPVFLMHVPRSWQRSSVREFFRGELARLGEFLVSLGGVAPSNERLAEVMGVYDRARRRLIESAGTLTAKELAVALVEYHELAEGVFPTPGAQPGVRHGRMPHEERPGGVPVALVGGPMLREELELFDVIEGYGGRVALDATDGGLRALPAALDPQRARQDPLAELAGAYFDIPGVFRRPNDGLYQALGAGLSASQGVRGIVLLRRVWCDLWHIEAARVKEWTSLPVLELELGDGFPGHERTRVRIESFLEMLR
jgi:benzoyl-CoA reductase/2-hydroxyglutaryl-CoA dehydratase subunit BcrC/BadD/HgdB